MTQVGERALEQCWKLPCLQVGSSSFQLLWWQKWQRWLVASCFSARLHQLQIIYWFGCKTCCERNWNVHRIWQVVQLKKTYFCLLWSIEKSGCLTYPIDYSYLYISLHWLYCNLQTNKRSLNKGDVKYNSLNLSLQFFMNLKDIIGDGVVISWDRK